MAYRQWNFDIDRYLNPLVPPAPWHHLPYPVARFFGYRKEKPGPTGNLVQIFWAFVGIWCVIAIIEQVSMHIPSFTHRQVPIIVGSYGATAVLEFLAIDSPLAQPRNAILGQLLSSVVGVGVAKLFLLSDDFESIRWAGGALACASATAVMGMTNTVHPPAGATALLAVTDPVLVSLGWFLVPVMLLSSVLMQVVALLVNNVDRRFPQYFWTPEDLQGTSIFARGKKQAVKDEEAVEQDGERAASEATVGQNGERDVEVGSGKEDHVHDDGDVLVIRGSGFVVPDTLELSDAERQVLEDIQGRLRR